MRQTLFPTVRSRLVSVCASLVVAAVAASPAGASQLIDRNASGIRLEVGRGGKEALLTYHAHGALKHVLAFGAINGRTPTHSAPQVKFHIDYSGGWGTYRKDVWRNYRNQCRPYDGPPLAWLVTACKAPDGSYWAVQSWQRMLPDLGFTPWLGAQSVWEVRLAHWSGPTAQLQVWPDWVYSGRFHELFGRLTYLGKPVYGFGNSVYGSPTDGYGRNLYLDTFDSAYGSGWRRENSFLAHRPTGVFCYGFYGFAPGAGTGYARPSYWPAGKKRPRGNGSQYRITVIGPGVSPDVMWQGKGLPDYNAANAQLVSIDQQVNGLIRQLAPHDKYCHHF